MERRIFHERELLVLGAGDRPAAGAPFLLDTRLFWVILRKTALGDRVELEGSCVFYAEGVAEF